MSYRAPLCPPSLLSRAFLALIPPSLAVKASSYNPCRRSDDRSTLSFNLLSIIGSACQLCVSSQRMSHWWAGADVHASIARLDIVCAFWNLASYLLPCSTCRHTWTNKEPNIAAAESEINQLCCVQASTHRGIGVAREARKGARAGSSSGQGSPAH